MYNILVKVPEPQNVRPRKAQSLPPGCIRLLQDLSWLLRAACTTATITWLAAPQLLLSQRPTRNTTLTLPAPQSCQPDVGSSGPA